MNIPGKYGAVLLIGLGALAAGCQGAEDGPSDLEWAAAGGLFLPRCRPLPTKLNMKFDHIMRTGGCQESITPEGLFHISCPIEYFGRPEYTYPTKTDYIREQDVFGRRAHLSRNSQSVKWDAAGRLSQLGFHYFDVWDFFGRPIAGTFDRPSNQAYTCVGGYCGYDGYPALKYNFEILYDATRQSVYEKREGEPPPVPNDTQYFPPGLMYYWDVIRINMGNSTHVEVLETKDICLD